MLFECMGICVLSPAHECEMMGSLVLSTSILFKFSRSILDCTAFLWIFFFFLEGSVDHIIYRDYIVNRSSFLSCNLVFTNSETADGAEGKLKPANQNIHNGSTMQSQPHTEWTITRARKRLSRSGRHGVPGLDLIAISQSIRFPLKSSSTRTLFRHSGRRIGYYVL